MFFIGFRLAQLRTRKGVTQVDLSRRTGIPQASLSNIEKGKQDPTVSTLLRIVAALGTPPSEFFKEDLPSLRLLSTRTAVERIARSVFDASVKVNSDEKFVIELLKDLIPGLRKKRPPMKRVQRAWYELKRLLSEKEIRILTERIRDEKMRRQ